ncbi:parallel beta-helix repeat protein [Methanococcus maripaludis]|uniref:Parallel beta-helix repeat protein n=1 Tax=Methanococcus maripaludis TaxID=39152 RepID=A0A7J9P600_METMI|nr:NosD domain-containing protein [Methanococcus maripaludis]MBA2858137.1 parallel beta-helix repeat protein [Methanococcus maripaludis]
MNELKFKTAILLALLTCLACISSVSSADTAINSTCVINTPGTYYLTDNITCTTDKVIEITCSNVVLDGQGYFIDGANSWGSGIYARGVSNITIKNVNIWNFGNGKDIGFYDVNNSFIKNNSVNSNQGGPGIRFDYSYNNTIVNNTVDSNEDGMILMFSSYNIIVNNTVDSNSNSGISLYSSSPNNTIMGNTANSNNFGIFVSSSSPNNTIIGNTANFNSNYGISLDSSGNTITNNTANLNKYGIYQSYSSNNTIIGNTANFNSNYGISLDSSNYNTITNNTVDSNEGGIYLYFSSNNIIVNNTANSNNDISKGYGIYLYFSSSNNTIIGNTANSNSKGIYLVSSSNYNTITNNTANFNSNYGIYLQSSSNYNTITNNTADSNEYGIFLTSSSNNTFIGNTANFNSNGIYQFSSSNNTFTGNTVNSNSIGIYLGASLNNTFTNNTADFNSKYGIYLQSSSSNNTFIGNNLSLNALDIMLESSSDNTIIGNTVDSNNVGISLTYSSNYNTITNNTVTGNTISKVIAISLADSNYNQIYNNIFNSSVDCSVGDGLMNYWNTSKEQGGGNYWFTPTGMGWSETHSDLNNDGFCDDQYNISTDNIDYLPKSLDMAAPEVIFNSILNGSIYNTSSILINVTAIDSSNVSLVTAEIENVKNITLSLNGSYYTGNTGNLLDGIYNITVTSKDENGNTNTTKPVTITIDTTAPKVIINHADDDFNRITNILNITINDLSLDSVIAEINNGTVLKNITLNETNGYFGNSDFEFVEGAYSVRIYANDSFGLVNSSETIDFMVDLTKPEVSIETLVNGSIINIPNSILNFTITDNFCESVICNITVNKVTVNSSEVNTSETLLFELTLEEGENNISIIVTDNAGNIWENTTKVVVDSTAPQIVFNNVLPYYNNNKSILNVSVIDNTSVTVNANIMHSEFLDKINLTNDSGYFGNSTYEFAEGINWVVAYAKDAAGNVNSNNTLIIVDITNPEVSIETANLSSSKELTINVTASDTYPNGTKISIVDALTGELINSTFNGSVGSYNATLTVPADGIYNVTANATDLAGNSNVTKPITVKVDTTNPEVVINNGFGPYNHNSSILNVSVSDFTPVTVIAEINGTKNITLENISGYFINSTYEFSEGLNTVKIYVNDLFGHMNSSENITFRIDLNLPVISVNTVEGGYFNNGSNVLNFTVAEEYIDSVTAFNGSTEILLNNSTGNYLNSVALNEGVYNVTIRINDTAGNIAEKSLNFIIDTTAPAAIMNTPVNGTTFTTSSASINVTANDSLSNVSSVTAKIGSVRNVTLFFDGNYYTGNTGTLSNGNYGIKILVTDLAGNVNSNETVNITVAVPSSSSRSSGSHYSSDLSEGITSSVIKNTVSNSNIVYGSEIDGEYAGKLKENLYNSEDYEISGDTIIVGGPKYNVLANKYDSKFGISISNDNPGENKGIIQLLKVQDNTGSIIQSYAVIYIAGSDRYGTQAALEYFKTLDEMPEGPITVKWTENGPVLA